MSAACPSTHGPKDGRLQLEPDEEKHHHNTELGEVLNRDDIHVQSGQDQADCDAREQGWDHTRCQKDNGNQEDIGHDPLKPKAKLGLHGRCGKKRKNTSGQALPPKVR